MTRQYNTDTHHWHAYGSHISGWMSEAELEWLFVRANELQSVIEIGCWFGRSTYALCFGCPGTVYAVDNFQGNLDPDIKKWYAANEPATDISDPFGTFLKNMEPFARLRTFPMASACASHNPLIPYTMDMVFIDGDHTYKGVGEDLKMWGKRAGKVLAGHDWDLPSVQNAVLDTLGKDFNYPPVKLGPGSIWYVEMNDAP